MKRWVRAGVAVALATPLVWTSPAGADGEPVVGFGVNGVVIDASYLRGKQAFVNDVLQLSDGSLVVNGFLSSPLEISLTETFVARYTPAGRLDFSFGGTGVIFPGGPVFDLAELADGRLLASGLTTFGYQQATIARDGSIVPGPPIGAFTIQLIERPDGAVFAMGAFPGLTQFPGATQVARLVKPNGLLDTSFSGVVGALLPSGGYLGAVPGQVGYLANGTLLADGRLVVAFSYYSPSTGQQCGLVALLSNGQHDPTFGVNGLASVSTPGCKVDRFIDDGIRLAGGFGDPSLLLSPDGVLVGPLPPPFEGPDLAVDGTGYSYTRSGPNSITAFDPFGDVDTTFGIGGSTTVPELDAFKFKLLDSGDLVTWGPPTSNGAAVGLAMIHGSFGTAPQPPAIDATKFVPVPPKRILDTREGLGAPSAKLAVGGQIDLQITGNGGVPAADISAVVLNVTATEVTQGGFVTAYPSGGRRPNASNLNVETPGQTAANLVTVKVGANGKVSLFSSGGTHLVADVAGYYTPVITSTSGRLKASAPQRILDTREGLGATKAKLAAGGQIDLQVTGVGPVPAAGVSAVVLNITGDQASDNGFVTAWPSGGTLPVVSNLNLTTGDSRANLAIVPVGAGGKISLFSSGGTELIADVAGWFTDSTEPDDSVGLFVPITPTRMLDTRQEPTSPIAPTSALTRRIGATTVVPPDATIAVAANITVTQSNGRGFVTAWPAHTPLPLVSNLNTTRAGQTVPNAAIVPLGVDDLALYTQTGAHLIVDINGWYTNY